MLKDAYFLKRPHFFNRSIDISYAFLHLKFEGRLSISVLGIRVALYYEDFKLEIEKFSEKVKCFETPTLAQSKNQLKFWLFLSSCHPTLCFL